MNRIALITGASSGIGREIALEAARNGHDCVLVARSTSSLEELAHRIETEYNRKTLVVPLDLRELDAPERLLQVVKEKAGVPELVVNNAGFGTGGRFSESDLKRESDMLTVNITALVKITRLFLPAMIDARKGTFLQVASVAGFLPGPYMAGYYASKAFVVNFSEALTEELRGTGVTSTVLCPGPTKTEFFKVAGVEDSATASGGLVSIMEADSVARAGYRGALKGKAIIVPGMNRFLPFLIRFAPRALVRRIAGNLNQKRGKKA